MTLLTDNKKIFFIHIGKTGGSSFNAFLGKYLNGEEHCEKYLDLDGKNFLNIEHLKTLDYISGHLKSTIFTKNNFSRKDYFLMTFLRDPVRQLISQLNWVMHIYDISPKFFYGHPEKIQQISLELRQLDLYDPDSLLLALRKFQGLFKNNQSRYFIANPEAVGSESVINSMSKLDMIGFTEYYEDSLKLFTLLNNLNINPEVHQINRNPNYRIKKDILDNDLINEFIQEYQKIDINVYNFFLPQFHELILNSQNDSIEIK